MLIFTRDIQSVMVSVQIQDAWRWHVLIHYAHHISCLPQQQHLILQPVGNQDTSVRVSGDVSYPAQLHTVYVTLVSCLHLSTPVNHHNLVFIPVTDNVLVTVTMTCYPVRPDVNSQVDDSQRLTIMCVAVNLVAMWITHHEITCQSVIVWSPRFIV